MRIFSPPHFSALLLFMLSHAAQAAETEILHDTLTISGESKVKVKARIADVRLLVQEDGRSALEVQQAIAKLAAPVIEGLRALKADRVEGGDLMIYPQYGKDNSNVIVGYRGQSSITFSAPADYAGTLIDAAIEAGANQVQGVSLRADREDVAHAREQALQEAAAMALREAKTVLTALGLEQRAIDAVTVHSPDAVNPIHPALYKASLESSSTKVLEEEQEVTANLTLRILYGRGGKGNALSIIQ